MWFSYGENDWMKEKQLRMQDVCALIHWTTEDGPAWGCEIILTSVFTSQSISQLLEGPHCGRERGVSQRVTLSAVNTAQSVTSVSASHLLGTMSAVWHVAGQNLKLVHPRLQVQLHPDHWGIPEREGGGGQRYKRETADVSQKAGRHEGWLTANIVHTCWF